MRMQMLVACIVLATAPVHTANAAAKDEADAPAGKSGDVKEIRVPIPSFSKDVADNGCRLRASPQEAFTGADADLRHVPFEDLIGEVVGRYSVRAMLDAPVAFEAKLADLTPEMRTLVMLDGLRNGLGRDGLHTYFFMSTAAHAPAMAEALKAAGMAREHGLFTQAMALFGPTYPIEEEARGQRFSYSSLDTPLNDFDRRMMDIARSFGDREAFGNAMVAYVGRTPALWARIESERSRLGDVARLRYLNNAIVARTKAWDTPKADVAAQLSAMPQEQRTLLVMHVFNAEFENGGVHQFFLNSSGAVAPEVHAAMLELGLERQAAIFKRALDMFGTTYARDTERRRKKHFDHADWNDWDRQLSALTDEFYALDGGPTAVRLGGTTGIAGGPGIWPAMAAYARKKNLLPC